MVGTNLVTEEIEEMGIHWDASVPGLGLRKNKRTKVWILKYRNNGIQTSHVIGPADVLGRDEARAIAKRIKWDAKQGKLPPPKKKVKSISVEKFCEEYLERHAKTKKPGSWHKDESRIKQYVLKAWGKKQLSSIEHADVANLHNEIGARAPVSANRLLEQLHKMFKLAMKWNYFPKDAENPAKDIDRFPESKKVRWLTKTEMERVIPLINELPLQRAAYFWMLIYTSRRRSEILKLKWKDVDLDTGTIYLGQTKNGDPDLVLMPQDAVAMLRQLPSHSEWVFPGRAGQHWKRPDKVWWKIRKTAGIPDVSIHHLRHTVASRLLAKKYPLKVVGAVLGHKSLASSNLYAHMAKEQIRDVVEDHASDFPRFVESIG